MGALEELADAIFAAAKALYAPQCPEIAPVDPKDPEKSPSGAIIEPYCFPKDPIYPPDPALTPGMALPRPQQTDLSAFLRQRRASAQLTPPSYAPPTPRKPHHPRWNKPWTRAEIVDLERRRLAGATLKELGTIRGISAAHVSHVLAKARRQRMQRRMRTRRSS